MRKAFEIVSGNCKHERFWLLSLLIVAITAAASSAQNSSASFAPHQRRLGAPGPENLTSPTRANLAVLPLDSSVTSSAAPNRTRDLTSNPGDNSTFGTLTIQRRIQNNTGQAITRLRFRIVELTTFPSSGTQADIRALTSASASVMNVNDVATCTAAGAGAPPCTVTAEGTTLESPPAQTNGGGFNSTVSVATGLPLAAGASLNVRFKLGVQQTGKFRFLIVVEALP
jgi:hypothetical protein